jgi:2-keto-4-pentenoate hydratase
MLMNGVLVVIRELRRLGQRLAPGDSISAGSFMPPMPVTKDLYTETVYEGMGGTTLKVAAWYR